MVYYRKNFSCYLNLRFDLFNLYSMNKQFQKNCTTSLFEFFFQRNLYSNSWAEAENVFNKYSC